MAMLEVENGKELMKQLADLEQKCPDIFEQMVKEGTRIAKARIVARSPSTRLAKATKEKKPKKSKTDIWYGRVEFPGYIPNTPKTKRHPKGTPWALLAAVFEYGSARHVQRQFIKRAMDSGEAEIINAMQKIYEQAEAEITK